MAVFILAISSCLQFSAALLCLRLIRISRTWQAWTCLAAAMTLAGLWCMYSLYHIVSSGEVYTANAGVTEITMLLVSVLVLTGILMIAPVFRKVANTQRELQRSEEKYRETIDFFPQAVSEIDAGGYITFLNRTGHEFFGEIDRKENGRTQIFDLIVPRDRKHARENMHQLVQGKTIEPNEYAMTRTDGTTFPALVYSTPVLQDGKPVGTRSLIVDITKRRKAEDELRISEARLRDAQRVGKIGSWEQDVAKDLVYWSNEIYTILGYDPQTTKPSYDAYQARVHPDDKDFVSNSFQKILKTRVPTDIGYRLMFEDGSIKYVNERWQILYEEAGNPVRIFGTLQDISERRRTEEKIERFSRILDESLNEIYLIDADSLQFIQVNHAAQHNLGYSMQELSQMTPLDIKPEYTHESFLELVAPLRRGEVEKLVFVTTHKRKDQSLYDTEVHLQYYRHSETPMFAAIILDISERKKAESELRRSEARFRGFFEQAAVGVALIHPESEKVIRVNKAFCDMLGYSQEELTDDEVVHQITHPDDREKDLELRTRIMSGEVSEYNLDKRYIHKNGSTVWVTLTISASGNPDDEPEARNIIAVAQNISDRVRSESELRKLSGGIEASPSSVLISNLDGIVEYVNPRFTEITGYAKEEILGQHLSIMRSAETPQNVIDELWQTVKSGGIWQGEVRDRKKDGTLFWDRLSISGIRDGAGDIRHIIANLEDMTHQYELTEKLSYQATHDSLTGLVNRQEFERRAQRLLSSTRHEHAEHAMCYMDLDQFKVVNDTCGHTAGDEMLRQLAHALQLVVRKRDTLARLGGDEFGILMEHCSPDHAHRVASNLQKVIQEYQFSWDDHVFKVGVSVGLVAITESFPNLTELLKQADVACYMAKDMGRNRIHVYHGEDAGMAQRHGEMQWVTRIYQALGQDRFCLFAQSIAPLDNRDDIHYELLLRMKNDEGELIPPGAFLPAAERYNVIELLDRWVIETTFRLLAEHPVFLNQINFISINLSGQSLTKTDFLDFIVSQLIKTGIEANKICFEITETTAISNLSAANSFISTLRGLQCRFALDDFGSGLSSFGYLKNLQVDYLKIDGMFVKDIVDDPIDRAMVKSINEIGHVMGMQTIAEFVENDEIKGMLREIGVNYAQGYGISKPQSFDDLLARSLNVTDIRNPNKSGAS